MHARFCFSLLILATLLSASGCGGSKLPDGMPPLQVFTLNLTQDGAPLAGANVVFYAEDPSNKWNVGGTSDPAGKIVPMTHGMYPGVPAGKYKVCVTKFETEPNPKGGYPLSFNLVEPELGAMETTTLTLDVAPGKKTETLDVGKKVRVAVDTGGA